MSYSGRPLRFLALVGGGWVALRVAFLWPTTGSLPQALREVLPLPTVTRAAELTAKAVPSPKRRISAPFQPTPRGAARRTKSDSLGDRTQFALRDLVRYGSDPPVSQHGPRDTAHPPGIAVLPVVDRATPASGTRLRVSAWAIARSGGEGDGPRLGGSQAGVRLRYRLDADDRVAAVARLATPLVGNGAEAAIGLEWRPIAAPIALVAEHRMGIDGAAGGPTLMAIGGVDRIALGGGVGLSAYAQGGAIARDQVEPFVDGAARVARPVAQLGPAMIDVGVGAWGAVQRGTARLDVGPGVAVALPLVGTTVRLGLDWRERVAGNARPSSGPALSIGTDF